MNDTITARQLEAARLAADGYTIPEIGEQLGISARTAKSHLREARRRLGVAHKRELVRALREVDGGLDDTAIIQSRIDTAVGGGGGTVCFERAFTVAEVKP